jgi:CheY-like chemotaxis protein
VADAVLIVEDDADLREMMERMLHLEGFAPLTAPNGQAALEVLLAGAPVKAILLDLMMPVMDGWEFRRQQLANPRIAAIPVVVMSAIDDERAQSIRAVATFRKPLAFDRVIIFLSELCAPRSAAV